MKNLVEPIRSKKDVEAIEKYLAKHSLRNQLIWVFGTNTGLRISDILGLNVESVKGKQYVEVVEKKTKKFKRFPLNKKLQKKYNFNSTNEKNTEIDELNKKLAIYREESAFYKNFSFVIMEVFYSKRNRRKNNK